MFNFQRGAPQVPVVLASLVLWVSFVWALPAEAPAAEGDADVAPEDPWVGVMISAPNAGRRTRSGRKRVRAAATSSLNHRGKRRAPGGYSYPVGGISARVRCWSPP
jgi:hypothetical protein